MSDDDRDFFFFLKKRCKHCAAEFFRPRGQHGISDKQWNQRMFCSVACRNRTITTKGRSFRGRKT